MKDRVFELCDIVRETGYAIHAYHGPGHVEKIYENALVHRLRKQGLKVSQQHPITIHDEDGTELGAYKVDLLVEDTLVVELKAARAIVVEHIAQLLGYLRGGHWEHGVLINFGAKKFYIKKYAMLDNPPLPGTKLGFLGALFSLLSLLCISCIFCG